MKTEFVFPKRINILIFVFLCHLFVFGIEISEVQAQQNSYSINFDDLPAGFNLANYQHPKVRFSTPPNQGVLVLNRWGYSTPQSPPNFIVSSCNGCYPYSGTLNIDFTTPVKDVLIWFSANAYYSLELNFHIYQNGVFTQTATFNNSGSAARYYADLRNYGDRITKVVIEPRSSSPVGVAFDNLNFTVVTYPPIGYLDGVNIQSGKANGWSLDPDSPSSSNAVHCYIGSTLIGGVSANLPSPDVPYPGNHRFELPIPLQFRDGGSHQIRCYGIDILGGDQNFQLTGSPKTFRFNPPIGNLDSVSSSVSSSDEPNNELDLDGVVGGWSLDRDVPEQSNTVHFYIDGQYVGQTIANIPRPDVNQVFGLPGNHGYEFSIPDQYRDDLSHSISAYGIDLTGDQSKILIGSPKTFQLRPRVQSVTFEPFVDATHGSSLSANPGNGVRGSAGGRRIFPDKNSSSDSLDRKTVLIKATVAPVRPNITVHFRSYDLDDPSANTAPIDPNGSAGNDNRGSAGTAQSAGLLSAASAVTDASGVAMVEFTPTMQPGDNFAVAASTNSTYLNGIAINGTNLRDSSNRILPTTNAKRTEMLTVWRKLHIEVDSMGPVTGNSVTGTFPASQTVAGQVATLQVNVTPSLEIDRFQNGRLEIEGRSYDIFENSANTISITIGRPFGITAGQSFTIYDDDDFNSNNIFNRPLNGDEQEDISMLSRDLLEDSDSPTLNAFAPAYIVPKYDIGNNNDSTPFQLNVATDDVQGVQALFTDFNASNTEASEDFWTIYLLSGYQYVEIEDADPETEAQTVGVMDDPTLTGSGTGAVVFLETNGAKECFGSAVFCNISATKIHEIGHLFRADHGQGGVMDDQSLIFAPPSLAVIRGTVHP